MINRSILPAGPVTAYRTFELSAPLQTHYRPASCAEVACDAHVKGWATDVLPDGDDERFLLRCARGDVDGVRRAWLPPELTPEGFRRYTFPPGQSCLRVSTHRVPLEREPVYIARGGDFRGNPTGQLRRHVNGVDWVEDFGENQQALHDAIERG